MALDIRTRKHEGVVIFDLAGRIVHGDGAEELMSAVKLLLSTREKKLLMNLANVTKVDSAGLGSIIAAYVSCRNQKATLKLLSPDHVRDLLVIAKLLTVFDIYDDEDHAIRSFGEETEAPAEPEQPETRETAAAGPQ